MNVGIKKVSKQGKKWIFILFKYKIKKIRIFFTKNYKIIYLFFRKIIFTIF